MNETITNGIVSGVAAAIIVAILFYCWKLIWIPLVKWFKEKRNLSSAESFSFYDDDDDDSGVWEDLNK